MPEKRSTSSKAHTWNDHCPASRPSAAAFREYEEPAADGPLFHWKKYQALSTRGTSRRIPTWTSSPKLPGGRQPLGGSWRERSQQVRLVVELVLCS